MNRWYKYIKMAKMTDVWYSWLMAEEDIYKLNKWLNVIFVFYQKRIVTILYTHKQTNNHKFIYQI